MADDHTVSLGVELTPSGLNVKAKSRLLWAWDRLFGHRAELADLSTERKLSRERAIIEGERRLIDAVTKKLVEWVETDEDFAGRAVRNYFGGAFDRQENKDAVARHALEDLRRDSSAEEGGTELDPNFMNKFERHAEDAATEQVREKWGRVLAAEVRKPGTVSAKVMRIVDEIDSETAKLFEKVCEDRMESAVPICLSGHLDLRAVAKLVGSGLLVDPGAAGQVRVFGEASYGEEVDFWYLRLFSERGLGIPRGAKFPNSYDHAAAPVVPYASSPFGKQESAGIPIYIITDEGLALAQILPDRQKNAFDRYVAKLSSFAPSLDIMIFGYGGPDCQVPMSGERLTRKS